MIRHSVLVLEALEALDGLECEREEARWDLRVDVLVVVQNQHVDDRHVEVCLPIGVCRLVWDTRQPS
jgi:hypothetical protein